MSHASNKKSNQQSRSNTATFLLTKQPREHVLPNDHNIKIVIVGSGHTGIAVAISILFKVSPNYLSFTFLPNLFAQDLIILRD